MRLSDAIATGRVLMESSNGHSFCGCASGIWRMAEEDEWPWLTESYSIPSLLTVEYNAENKIPAIDIISDLFFEVERKAISLDQLIDWVRSVEPAEQPASEPAPREEVQSEQTQARR